MPTPSDAPGSAFPRDPRDVGDQTGGADAAEKTSYVVGKGGEPESIRAPGEKAPTFDDAAPRARGWTAVIVLLALGGLIYLLAR